MPRGKRRAVPPVRKDTMRCFAVLLVLSLTLAACASMSASCPEGLNEKGGRIFRLTANDNDRTITATPGDTLVITLDRAGATGYDWHLEPASGDHWTLLVEKSEPKAPQPGNGLLGAPVTKRWELLLTQRGDITITISLYRDWEGAAKHIDAFCLNVVIR
jgi:predicted secreted protein